MLLGAGGPLRGGGAGQEAAGAHGPGGEEEPAAEGACAQGEALTAQCPQGHAQGRAGPAGAAGETEGGGETGGTPPQHHHTRGAAGETLRCIATPTDVALT